jgi:tetratricopeptide (TPR) repeat protein
LELVPDFVEAHNNIGTLLGALGRSDEAIEHFERAIALRPKLVTSHANLSVALYLQGRLEEAEMQYRRTLQIEPANAAVMGHLGEILVERGCLDEARNLLERAIECAPETGWLYRRWAETRPVQLGDAPFRAMETLKARLASLPPDDRMQLQYALGKAYDDLGRWSEAFAHVRAANAAKRRQITYDEPATLQSMQRARELLTAETMQAYAGSGDPSRLPVFIVGMPRSGTTLVEQIVAAHPRAFGAGEAGAFERLAAAHSGPPFRKLGTAYVEFVAKLAPTAARVTDKTLQNVQLLGLTALALPNARILHVVREPVDTCFSAYAQLFRDGQPFSYDLGELGRYYRAYASLMGHWRSVLPPGTMLEVRYEELVENLETQARRIVDHCGLAWDSACLAFHAASRQVATASAAQVRRPLYATAIGRGRRYQPWLGELIEALEGS